MMLEVCDWRNTTTMYFNFSDCSTGKIRLTRNSDEVTANMSSSENVTMATLGNYAIEVAYSNILTVGIPYSAEKNVC